jgi:hypothetical protein
MNPFSSWPGLSRPSTFLLLLHSQDVDARHKAGHDGERNSNGVSISGSIGETAQGATHKSVTAGFKHSW